LYVETNVVVKEVGDDAVAEINGPATICVGDPVTFEATDSGSGAEYSWNFGPSATPSMSEDPVVEVTFSAYGLVNIQLEVKNNGCTSYATKPVFITNSPTLCSNMLNGSSSTQFSTQVWPNPVQQRLYVQLPPVFETTAFVQLLTRDGQVLEQRQGYALETLEFNVLDLPAGLYLIRVQVPGQEVEMQKVVKY